MDVVRGCAGWPTVNGTNFWSESSNDLQCSMPGRSSVSITSSLSMFSTGAVGNLLALGVLHRSAERHKNRRTVFYVLLFFLIVTDLSGQVCLSIPPLVVHSRATFHPPPVNRTVYQWLGGMQLCATYALLMIAFGLATPIIVCFMTVERVLYLLNWSVYGDYVNKRRTVLAITGAWLFSLAFGALPLLQFGTYAHQFPGTWCYLNFNHLHLAPPATASKIYACMYAMVNVAFICIIVWGNVFVIGMLLRARRTRRGLMRERRRASSSTASCGCSFNSRMSTTQPYNGTTGASIRRRSSSLKRNSFTNIELPTSQQHQLTNSIKSGSSGRLYYRLSGQQLACKRCVHRRLSSILMKDLEIQMIVLLSAITIVFTTCWAPLMIRILQNAFSSKERNVRADLLAIRFASFNQVLDPWVYILLRKSNLVAVFRSLRRLVACCCCAIKEETTGPTVRPPVGTMLAMGRPMSQTKAEDTLPLGEALAPLTEEAEGTKSQYGSSQQPPSSSQQRADSPMESGDQLPVAFYASSSSSLAIVALGPLTRTDRTE